MFLIAVYVDDILLAGNGCEKLDASKQAFSQEFQVRDMGKLHYFKKVVQDKDTGNIWIG